MAKKQLTANDVQISMDETMRATRIGTCYNGFTQEIITTSTAIDLDKLNKAGKLLFTGGTAEFKFVASSDNSSSENSSQWGMDVSAGGGAYGVKASAAYNMHKSYAHTTESKSMNAVISNKYIGQFFQMQNSSEEVLFNCMSEDFKTGFKKIMAAQTADDKLAEYRKFINDFGTGCVTKLYLSSGSIANISIATDASADSNDANYGASLAVHSAFVDVSGAASWANSCKTAGIKGTVNVTQISYPENTPTKEWVNALVSAFNGKAIDAMTQSASFASLPQPIFKDAPPYPGTKEPSKEKIDNKGVDFSDAMQKSIMKEDGFNGSWDDYVKAQKAALDKCNPKDIVEEANSTHNSLVLMRSDTDRPKMFGGLLADAQANNYSVGGSSWDLGGYTPADFRVTPWTELFPSLAAPFQYNTSSILLAKLISFYYTRLQFGQYLQFLSDTGDAYKSAKKGYIQSDVAYYQLACKAYLQDMLAHLPNKITEADYKNWIACFGNYLNNKNFEGNTITIDGTAIKVDFHNSEIYKVFYQNYSFFDRCCFGMVYQARTEQGQMGEINNLDLETDQGKPFAFGNLYITNSDFDSVHRSIRFYPVLEVANQGTSAYPAGTVVVSIVYYDNKKFNRLTVPMITASLDSMVMGDHLRSESYPASLISQFNKWDSRSTSQVATWNWPYWDENKNRYVTDSITVFTLKPIGNIEVNSLILSGGGQMKGIKPMFQNFPFDAAQAYPKGA
jgi:hypothetical protein